MRHDNPDTGPDQWENMSEINTPICTHCGHPRSSHRTRELSCPVYKRNGELSGWSFHSFTPDPPPEPKLYTAADLALAEKKGFAAGLEAICGACDKRLAFHSTKDAARCNDALARAREEERREAVKEAYRGIFPFGDEQETVSTLLVRNILESVSPGAIDALIAEGKECPS
jgi:hypothetical protein